MWDPQIRGFTKSFSVVRYDTREVSRFLNACIRSRVVRLVGDDLPRYIARFFVANGLFLPYNHGGTLNYSTRGELRETRRALSSRPRIAVCERVPDFPGLATFWQ